METEDGHDRRLAAAALAALREPAQGTAAVDPMRLAAWLEGRLDEVSSQAVERLLAAEPALLDALLAAREAGQAATTQGEVEAARALVRDPWWRRLLPGAEGRPLRWAPVLAGSMLVLALATGAFELGEALAGISLAQQAGTARAMLGDDLFSTFGEK